MTQPLGIDEHGGEHKPMSTAIRELRLILGDQLNAQHPWFRSKADDIVYAIAEVPAETCYVKHHIQKVCGFFLAMENFAKALRAAGHRVLYLTLDDTAAHPDFPALLTHLVAAYEPRSFSYQQPDEYRLHQALQLWCENSDLITQCVDSAHFLLQQSEIAKWLPKDKAWRMEFFYRKMRQHHHVLMDQQQPLGGEWNYDKENRQPLGKQTQVPPPLLFDHDVSEIVARLQRHHRDRLASNHRLAMIYRNWDRRSAEDKAAVITTAQDYLARLDAL